SCVVGGVLDYLVSRRALRFISPLSVAGIFGGRGAVGVVIATVALSSGVINENYFSVIIFATVITSLVMPSFVGRKMTEQVSETFPT
ncbi:MAG: hypothetical protein QXV22_02220, partial [Thermoplasmataceae archaeon]